MELNNKSPLSLTLPDWHDRKILIVEDVHTNLLFLKAALSKTGANLLWASDGYEAIRKVQQEPDIELILMDLRLPNLDGFKATETIKSIRPDIPIIAQTTFTDEFDTRRIEDAGCDAYLAKPIRLDELIQTLTRFLDK